MRLNENDARAVDMLLSGVHGLPDGSAAAGAAGGHGYPGNSTGTASTGTHSGAAGAVSAMSDEQANRVTRADDMLRLLDYLPVEEPPATLVHRTMRRIEEARLQARIPAHGAGLGAVTPDAGRGAGFGQGVHRSPSAGGDEDPATA